MTDEPTTAARPLDVERTRRVLCEMEHEIRHPGNGVAESCIECLRAADGILADLAIEAEAREQDGSALERLARARSRLLALPLFNPNYRVMADNDRFLVVAILDEEGIG